MGSRRKRKQKKQLIWLLESCAAVVALTNLGLVLFDLSYVPWRDFWFQGNIQVFALKVQLPLPPVTQWYDKYKGIEPNRDTQFYLLQVDKLEAQVAEEGLKSEPAQAQLEKLRELSVAMVNENPFQLAGKTGTLERIKNRMRDRIEVDSSKLAFRTFWSEAHLSRENWLAEMDFFTKEIRPLIETNFFRKPGENSEFLDQFWLFDSVFVLFFAVELLVRVFFIHRRHPSLSWLEALLWRWYDVFLFLPFLRWLRVLPVAIRLQDAGWVDFETVRAQFSRGFVATFAGELTEIMAVQAINQVQGSVKRGEIARWLLPALSKQYIDINDTNEVEQIIRLLAELIVYQVLPKIQPDLEALLHHNIENTLKLSPAYQGLQRLPGVGDLPTKLTRELVAQASNLLTSLSQTTYDTFAQPDAKATDLTEQLIQHFNEALGDAVQNRETLQELQFLISDLLEEVKLNYVRNLSEEDFEEIMEESQQLTRGK